MTEKTKRYIYLFSLITSVIVFSFAIFFRSQIYIFTQKTIFGSSSSSSASTSTPQNFLTVLSDSLISEDIPQTKKGLLLKYCSTIFSGGLDKGFLNGEFQYNPSSSLFLYQACGYVDPSLRDKFDPAFKKYVKDFDIGYFRSLSQFKGCDAEGEMDGCNLIPFLSKVYGGIMNEYSNIKLAALYGYTDPTAKAEDLVKSFSDTYFGDKVCAGKFYLYGEKVGTEDGYCSHPKTFSVLFDYIKNIQLTVSNSKFVNSDELLKLSSGGGCDQKDIYKCAFANNSNSWIHFRNVNTNELMFYNMFISYYTYTISSDPTYQSFEVSSNVGKKFDQINAEIQAANKELVISQKAVFQVDRMLRNMYATFPTHIGMLAYYEDILNFRDALAKVYTPVNQLYYKLRNVQDVGK